MNPVRLAAPTGANPTPDNSASEGRAAPHGEHWTRAISPIDATTFNATGPVTPPSGFSATYPTDLVALSVARKSDSSGKGSGTGRRASGFGSLDSGGTLVFVTGAGNTETWAVGAGVACSVEMTRLVSYSGTSLVVFW